MTTLELTARALHEQLLLRYPQIRPQDTNIISYSNTCRIRIRPRTVEIEGGRYLITIWVTPGLIQLSSDESEMSDWFELNDPDSLDTLFATIDQYYIYDN
jgi:hypothetical protein